MVWPLWKTVWQFLIKLSIHLVYDPTIPLLVTYPKENLCSQKNLYAKAYSGFIHNCPKLETTQMAFNERLVKQTVIHPYHATLLSNKKNELSYIQRYG